MRKKKVEKRITGKTKKTRILARIGKEEILLLAQKIWQGQTNLDTKIASEALTIIHEKYEANPTFFSGKSIKGIVGGLFYLLGQRYGNFKTQRQIATSLSTTEVTVRASCRMWTEPVRKHYGYARTR
jgi:transcription initiation factor TFIIIB Brf1 subunit/transcription initiation factor TFIIB